MLAILAMLARQGACAWLRVAPLLPSPALRAAARNVSTTLIHPGSEFKLYFRTSIERLSAGQVYRLLALGLADRRLNRRRAWTRMALRNETQWKPAQETWREGRRRPSFRKRCQDEEGTSRFIDLNVTWTGVQAGLFGVGGLIQVAVGLSGGVGALLTKRSGLSRNAWSRVI